MFTQKKLGLSRSLMIVCMAVATINNISVKADFTFGSLTNLGSVVNTSASAEDPEISADGLKLYFNSNRADGYGKGDIWVTSRATIEDNWEIPVNLGLTVNSSSDDFAPDVSPDGLTLHFASDRPGGYGNYDLWVTSRVTIEDNWGMPENLGPNINSSAMDCCPAISDDGLELYFWSNRPSGSGSTDLWKATRATTEDDWGMPVNLGPLLNSVDQDFCPYISTDGLSLFFASSRSGGYGGFYGDIWMSTRPTMNDSWGTPVNLGPMINSSASEAGPALSADGSIFYFSSEMPGGFGSFDIWQVSINPIVDFNVNGICDIDDLVLMIENWGTSESLGDIGPTPFGDGIVDKADLEVLMEYYNQVVDVAAYWKLDEAEGLIAYDSSGNYHDANIMGDPNWQPEDGMVDGALEFDGINDYVSTPFILNPSDGEFSVFAWVKGGEPEQVILSQADGVNWLLADSSDGCLMTELRATGGRSEKMLVSSALITDDNWHRIGFVWDVTDRILYVDDFEVARDTQSHLTGSEGGLYIGAGNNLDPDTLFLGLIDDVCIYDRVITP